MAVKEREVPLEMPPKCYSLIAGFIFRLGYFHEAGSPFREYSRTINPRIVIYLYNAHVSSRKLVRYFIRLNYFN